METEEAIPRVIAGPSPEVCLSLRHAAAKRPAAVVWRRGSCGGAWALPCGVLAGRAGLCLHGQLADGAVIAAVPRVAAGPCGPPGASAVRPCRPAATPWPAP